MKQGTCIVSCDRCGKKFMLDVGVEHVLISQHHADKPFKSVPASLGFTYHKYLQEISIQKQETSGLVYGYTVQDYTDKKLFCKSCDQDYWANFEKAVEILAAFFVKGGDE